MASPRWQAEDGKGFSNPILSGSANSFSFFCHPAGAKLFVAMTTRKTIATPDFTHRFTCG
jgi:hypothetical protein